MIYKRETRGKLCKFKERYVPFNYFIKKPPKINKKVFASKTNKQTLLIWFVSVCTNFITLLLSFNYHANDPNNYLLTF